jgi:ABC-type lipoprotein export system ATPase subunit
MQPHLLLCDEPTGNLDQKSADAVASLLVELQQRQETILIMVTHNPELAGCFPRQYQLRDQRLYEA